MGITDPRDNYFAVRLLPNLLRKIAINVLDTYNDI